MPQPKKPASASRRKPGAPPASTAPDELAAHLGALRERLVSSVTLTTERLQDTVEDAVRRGRMTRKDAEDLLATLLSAGRQQTESLLADVEHMLGRKPSVRRFPIAGYDDLTAAQITKRLADLTPAQLRRVRDREQRGAARKSVLSAVARRLG